MGGVDGVHEWSEREGVNRLHPGRVLCAGRACRQERSAHLQRTSQVNTHTTHRRTRHAHAHDTYTNGRCTWKV